jgi:Flp pilus assembly protein TadG
MKAHNGSRRRRAATVVEMALVSSIALLFLIGIFEYGRLFLMKQTLENAAREGARYAVVNTNMTLSSASTDPEKEIREKIKSFLVGLDTKVQDFDVEVKAIVLKPGTGETKGQVRSSWTDAKETDGIQVTITGKFIPVVPSFLRMGATIPLSATSEMYSEAN